MSADVEPIADATAFEEMIIRACVRAVMAGESISYASIAAATDFPEAYLRSCFSIADPAPNDLECAS